MSDRKIEDLSPEMQTAYNKWAEGMKAENIDFLITCTLRTQAEQEALYAIGRTVPGQKVTWTLHSKHLIGEAFDFVIMWNGKPDWAMTRKEDWNKAIALGEDVGLGQVIGLSGKVMEFAHLQL